MEKEGVISLRLNQEEIKKHVRVYLMVFVTLAALTAVTVGVATFRLEIHVAVGLALIIATVKGSLVACYFMHLISEKKLIYSFLVITAIFLIVMFVLPVWTDSDMVII